jgi:hypothetical protein
MKGFWQLSLVCIISRDHKQLTKWQPLYSHMPAYPEISSFALIGDNAEIVLRTGSLYNTYYYTL